ncbi:MAG: hypothetical protein HQ488_04190 [Parcubacteria group bacterium]|nr:hypothetical protein [Parcubacteria group bacterium]
MSVPRPPQVTNLFHSEVFCRRVLQRFKHHQGFDSCGDQTGLLVQMPGGGSVPSVLEHVQVVYIVGDRVYMSKVQRVVEGRDGIVKRFVLVGFHRVDLGIVPASQYSNGVHLNLFTTWWWLPPIRTSFAPPTNLPDEQVA